MFCIVMNIRKILSIGFIFGLALGCQSPPDKTNLVSDDVDIRPIREAKNEDRRNLGTAMYAKTLCSMMFISKHPEDFAVAHAQRVSVDLGKVSDDLIDGLSYEIDDETQVVRASHALEGSETITRTSRRYGDQGCVIHPDDYDGIYFVPVPVVTSLPDRDTTPWPMGDVLPDEPFAPEVDKEKIEAALGIAFEDPSPLSAMVVLYKGRLVGEKYAEGITKDTLLENWSMGKSLTATLAARLIQDGHFGLDDPAPVPAWRVEGDPRGVIRVSDLFRMSSGLQFSLYEVAAPNESGGLDWTGPYPDHYYVYSGAVDVFRYVTSRPLQYEPNTVGRYRNTDPLTLGYIVKRTVMERGGEYLTYPQRELFDEIGIRKLILETDPHGNFVSSGYELGRARDWARLGQLYLQDGVWNGKRLLPEGFVDFVRTPAPAWDNEEGKPSTSRYGGMWWLNTTGTWNAPSDAYYASGAGGQNTIVIPSREVVVARLTDYDASSSPSIGKTKTDTALKAVLEAIQ